MPEFDAFADELREHYPLPSRAATERARAAVRHTAAGEPSPWSRSFQSVTGRQDTVRGRVRLPRRRLVAAVFIAVALGIPALALSGALGSLFGFSNQGTPVPGGFQTVHALNVTGAKPGTLVELRSSDGEAVYAARERKGSHFCFYFGPTGSDPNVSGQCLGIRGLSGADFPSRAQPVWDMSNVANGFQLPNLAKDEGTVTLLIGVAADGVRSVQVLALSNCHAVVTVPVIDNVYIDTKLPMTPEALIVARDARGKAVWRRLVSFKAKQRACGLHGGQLH